MFTAANAVPYHAQTVARDLPSTAQCQLEAAHALVRVPGEDRLLCQPVRRVFVAPGAPSVEVLYVGNVGITRYGNFNENNWGCRNCAFCPNEKTGSDAKVVGITSWRISTAWRATCLFFDPFLRPPLLRAEVLQTLDEPGKRHGWLIKLPIGKQLG